MTFNLLGHSHTVRGRHAWMGSGPERLRRAVRVVDYRRADLVGFQEMQPPQVAEFLRVRGRDWGLYPAARLRGLDGENSIAWRKRVWRVARAGTVPIPYFNGNIRQMPLLLMEHRASHRRTWVLNVHNPATNRRRGNQDRWRRAAIALEIATTNARRAESPTTPVLVVGDMNEREGVLCPFGRRAGLRAANGGTVTRTTCRMPPGPRPVDWIFGTADVTFSGYRALRTPRIVRTTDHPVVLSRAVLAR
jgi:endonuclease/exonuclease/phosphatase family metal-dependent hydrolase